MSKKGLCRNISSDVNDTAPYKGLLSYSETYRIDNVCAPNRINARFVRAEIISWRTAERDVQPLSRTSFFPSFSGLLLRSLLS